VTDHRDVTGLHAVQAVGQHQNLPRVRDRHVFRRDRHRRPRVDVAVQVASTAQVAEVGGGELSYWRTQSDVEVDFIWSRGPHVVAIDCKAKDRWQNRDDAGLLALAEKVPTMRACGVYLGQMPLRRAWGIARPLGDFLGSLWRGEILPEPT